MNRDDELNARLAAEVLAMPIDAVRRELEEAGLYPADGAEAYPKVAAYCAGRMAVNNAANDDDEPLVRMRAFDGSNGAPAIVDAPGAGLLGPIAGAQGRGTLALGDDTVELHLEKSAMITHVRLGAEEFVLRPVDGSGFVYTVIGLVEDAAYLFVFDHEAAPDSHPVSWR